ncbi:MAG: hypothetical protein F6J97_01730 [Leptolyngbya sp. SIO4C1]|nr:hypothetical protein [Leptolyngbya sp. SIO4C1]
MASQENVREYLAYWFQLGKRVIVRNGQSACRPQPVLEGNRFSREFENCWAQIMINDGRDCYLEGTSVTLDRLLTSEWDIDECPRCELPIAVPTAAYNIEPCPCSDLLHWPNFEVPHPHLPINTQQKLNALNQRLRSKESPT